MINGHETAGRRRDCCAACRDLGIRHTDESRGRGGGSDSRGSTHAFWGIYLNVKHTVLCRRRDFAKKMGTIVLMCYQSGPLHVSVTRDFDDFWSLDPPVRCMIVFPVPVRSALSDLNQIAITGKMRITLTFRIA